MKAETDKRLLQMTTGLSCLVPLCAGLMGAMQGTAMLNPAIAAALDSQYRYLSGLLLGIGLSFLVTIPNIEKHSERFALLSCIVMIGGAARLYGMLTGGNPGADMTLALVMELGVVPTLWLWQRRLAGGWRT